ncbi:hypothetical protein [Streptomyces jumonjinensis]|uniref:hypothetical protein n=1 Tax=Streptomyces jumonjinensis TaxID=1945 RepID=UPI00378C6D7C
MEDTTDTAPLARRLSSAPTREYGAPWLPVAGPGTPSTGGLDDAPDLDACAREEEQVLFTQ